MRFHNRLNAPTNLEIRKQSLEEIHNHSKHSTFMRKQRYRDQKQYFGYIKVNKEITKHGNKSLSYQKV